MLEKAADKLMDVFEELLDAIDRGWEVRKRGGMYVATFSAFDWAQCSGQTVRELLDEITRIDPNPTQREGGAVQETREAFDNARVKQANEDAKATVSEICRMANQRSNDSFDELPPPEGNEKRPEPEPLPNYLCAVWKYPDSRHACHCDMNTLQRQGCQCGGV